MNSRRMEFFIGMMVIGIVAGVFVMTLLFHSDNGIFVGGKSGKRMSIEFKDGAGISQNSLVLKSGIKIGRVFSVVLLDDVADSRVKVTFELEPEAKIYSNEVAKINRTFLGDASIEIVDNPDYEGEITELGPDAVLASLKTGDIMSTVSNLEGDLGLALQNVNAATEGVAQFMGKANQFFGTEAEIEDKKERLQNVFNELSDTLVSVKVLAAHVDEVVTDEDLRAKLRDAVDKVPSIMKRVDEIAAKADVFMDNATEVSSGVRETLKRANTTFDLVDKNLDNVDVFTTSLAENGPEMMTSLNAGAVEIKGAIDDVKSAIDNISQLANSLNENMSNPDTPIGMLSDKDVAKDLRKVVSNAEELTEKLYPILDDARVFSNKIAHKPSSLIWDKTTTKGGTLSEKFGWQVKSPNGGVGSPLYRQTPNGAGICERSYYKPSADTNYMDAQTRAAYQNELADRQYASDDMSAYANAYANGQLGANSRVLPEATAYPDSSNGFCAEIKARTSRVKLSLDSFFSKFSPSRFAQKYAEPVEYGDAVYEGAYPGDGEFVDQASYLQDGSFGGIVNAGGESYLAADGMQADFVPNGQFQTADGSCFDQSQCGVSQCGVPSQCGVGCGLPSENCAVPTQNCNPGCGGAPAYGASANGYDPQRARQNAPNASGSLGAYRSSEPQKLEQSDQDFGAEVEELPSSINRVAAPNVNDSNPNSMSGGAFEDDGLPLEFAPPARQ